MVEGDYWLYVLPVKSVAAGSAIEFAATMSGDANAPKYFIVEYYEDGTWKSVAEDLRTATEDSSIKYTYMSSGDISGSGYQNATVMQTIKLANAVTDGEVRIRCRVVGNMTASGGTQDINATSKNHTMMTKFGFTTSYVQNYGVVNIKDTKTLLCLGNSFSYYFHPVFMLKEIAYSQGHYLRIRAHLKGSQSLTQHYTRSFSLDAVNIGGYDFAFMQDKSMSPADYGKDPEGTADANSSGESSATIKSGCVNMANLIRSKSPSCKVILEETWAFPGSKSDYNSFGSYEQFDAYSEAGALALAKAANTWVSPIGKAFKAARANTAINLLYTDNKHQGAYGAYLKACVNYLVLYGEAFTGDVPSCGLDPEKAAYLRGIAEQTVLGHESENLIVR